MMYMSVIIPGTPVKIQAALPGRLNLDSIEVLPAGYQLGTSHWRDANYFP